MSKHALSWLNRALARVLMLPVQAYRLLLSPWLGTACRFNPTCSAYALQALQVHGAAKGSQLTAQRLLRCHPWCAGGHDPVPSAQRSVLPPELLLSKKST